MNPLPEITKLYDALEAIKEATGSEWTYSMCKEALAGRERVLSALPMWHDIKTAPKDGNDFLACQFFDNSNRRVVIHTPEGEEKIVSAANGYIIYQLRWNDDKEAFFDLVEGETVDMKYFDYWQPSPQPPLSQIQTEQSHDK